MTTEAEVLALFPDNTTGAIDAADERAAVEAIFERFDGETAVDGTLFNVNPPVPAHTPGHIHWNSTAGTLDLMSEISGVTLQVGQEQWLVVRNNSGSTILNGRPVRLTGASGNRPTIALDTGIGLNVGMATHDIPNNTNGIVTTFGLVRGVNTSAFSDGQQVYATSTGTLTTTVTSSRVGYILLANTTNGIILSVPERRTHSSGTTAQRPTTVIEGFMYMDSTLGHPVFRHGANWIDATGAVV